MEPSVRLSVCPVRAQKSRTEAHKHFSQKLQFCTEYSLARISDSTIVGQRSEVIEVRVTLAHGIFELATRCFTSLYTTFADAVRCCIEGG